MSTYSNEAALKRTTMKSLGEHTPSARSASPMRKPGATCSHARAEEYCWICRVPRRCPAYRPPTRPVRASLIGLRAWRLGPLGGFAAVLLSCAGTGTPVSESPSADPVVTLDVSNRIDTLMRDAIREQHVAAVSLAI